MAAWGGGDYAHVCGSPRGRDEDIRGKQAAETREAGGRRRRKTHIAQPRPMPLPEQGRQHSVGVAITAHRAPSNDEHAGPAGGPCSSIALRLAPWMPAHRRQIDDGQVRWRKYHLQRHPRCRQCIGPIVAPSRLPPPVGLSAACICAVIATQHTCRRPPAAPQTCQRTEFTALPLACATHHSGKDGPSALSPRSRARRTVEVEVEA